MWFLPPTTVTISTHLQIVHNTHNDMSRESLDITDQIKYELFALPSSGSRSVADLARSSPHPHSRMQTQQSTGRRPAGLPTSPGGQVNGISSAQCGRYPGLRDREGDIVLQWGVSRRLWIWFWEHFWLSCELLSCNCDAICQVVSS
jgi:hypothetical protein